MILVPWEPFRKCPAHLALGSIAANLDGFGQPLRAIESDFQGKRSKVPKFLIPRMGGHLETRAGLPRMH